MKTWKRNGSWILTTRRRQSGPRKTISYLTGEQGNISALSADIYGAEFMDLLIRAGGLTAELVAGDIQNLQSLIVVISIHLLNRLILRRKATASGSVDDHDNLALIVGQI